MNQYQMPPYTKFWQRFLWRIKLKVITMPLWLKIFAIALLVFQVWIVWWCRQGHAGDKIVLFPSPHIEVEQGVANRAI